MEQIEKDFLPRPYQISLYEKAVESNSIIYLPTGSGKTYIAVLLIKRLSTAVQKSYMLGGKRTIFIVNTVALVIQQCAFLNRHTGLNCKGYSGDMQVDFWTESQWSKEIETNQVLVMTAQIFLDLLVHGRLPLSKVNLLIFDECHRAVKDHPMRQIMKRFEDYSENELPRVLAMSGSLLNSNVKYNKIALILKNLEITFHSKIITVESVESIASFSTNPQESLEYYEPGKQFEIEKHIDKIIDDALSILHLIDIPNKMENPASSDIFKAVSKTVKLKRILLDVLELIKDTGIYGGKECVLLRLIQLEYFKKFSDDQEVTSILDFVITQLMKIQKMLALEIEEPVTIDSIFKFSSPKVLKLFNILKSFYENLKNDEKFCCIIFVKRRFSAKTLYHILKKLISTDKTFEFLKPEFIVGYNNDPYKNAREQLCLSLHNKEVLTKFRTGLVNCMIATDVVDEGIDIPACTLVIRYSAPVDFRAYVQSKGRARHSTSKFIVLASTEDEYGKHYAIFQKTESLLKESLHGKSEYRLKATENEVNTFLYNDVIEPYIISKLDGTKSILTEHMAISLINRYCACLNKSKFIMLTPTWVKEDVFVNGIAFFKVLLTLPPSSTLRDVIIGNEMSSLMLAKRSAALKACIELHKLGELDDNFLPKKVDDCLLHTKHLFPYMEEDTSDKTAGTNSKKRRHKRIYPIALCSAYPKVEHLLYLHIIEMKPNYSKPINDNRHLVFYDLLSSRCSYGILSSQKMPNIPSFPIFMNVGSLNVRIKSNNIIRALSNSDIRSLKIFHTLIFNHILNIIKEFMIFDIRNKENSFLVVPTNEKGEINWDIVTRYNTITSIPPSKPIEVKTSEYEMALVAPNYRASNVYIVTQICDYLKANSRFPTPEFASYVEYFKCKHDLHIVSKDQPMLEVKPISKKINCIKPRNIKAGMSKRKRANLTEDFEEHLVPELCERIDFPALYWLKATVLPSILHRVSQLLVAEDLRLLIKKETNLNLKCETENINWSPIQLNEQIEETMSEANNDTIFEESFLEDELDMDINDMTLKNSAMEIDLFSQDRSQYSWKKEQEPLDLERNADRIQLIDIEYYCQFMSAVTLEDEKFLKNQNIPKSTYVYSPDVSVPTLKMLSKINMYGPSPFDIMQSLTAKTSHDAFNLERAETLGDSFLKFAVSLYLFQVYPQLGEGPLTFLKGRLVGNLNLFYCGKQKCIPGRMNVEDFSPFSNFITPLYNIESRLQQLLIELEVSANILYELRIPVEERFSGIVSNNTIAMMQEKLSEWNTEKVIQTGMEHFLGLQVISDKSVSDCVEALIGTYLLNLGVEGALSILKWFEILPKTLQITELLNSKVPDPHLGNGDINQHMPWANVIENRLRYKFQNQAFLLEALTHPSYIINRETSSYQRLEFLGDAVLDFLLTVYIYEACGSLSPGELTDLRSALVNNVTFACLAVRYSLHTALLAYAPKLFNAIDKFVKFQEDRMHEVNDELLWILLEDDDCNMSEQVDVPKVLGDIFESVIGAIYLDSGKNLNITWSVIYSLMKKEIELFSQNVPKQPIRVIYETQRANPKFSSSRSVPNSQTVMVTLTINDANKKRKAFHGFGVTKKSAKCAASKMALKYLRSKNQII